MASTLAIPYNTFAAVLPRHSAVAYTQFPAPASARGYLHNTHAAAVQCAPVCMGRGAAPARGASSDLGGG